MAKSSCNGRQEESPLAKRARGVTDTVDTGTLGMD